MKKIEEVRKELERLKNIMQSAQGIDREDYAELSAKTAALGWVLEMQEETGDVISKITHMGFHKILIAIDSNPSSEIVAQNGLQLAKQFNSEIALISVIDPESYPDEDEATIREREDMMEHNLNKSQGNVMEKVFKNTPFSSFVEVGTPSKAILRVAEEWGADVIVMGTHGRKGLPHLLMGSVAEDLIRHSKKAVVIIPVVN